MLNNGAKRVQIARELDNPAVALFADFNLDAFGLLLPKRFTGAATGPVSDGVSKILEYFSFPSLNVVFSVAGSLQEWGRNNLALKGVVEEIDIRLKLQALDENARQLGEEHLSVLGIEPSEIESQTIVKDEKDQDSFQFEFKPELSAIFKAIQDQASGGGEDFPIGAITAVASAAAQGLELAFRSKKKKKPKKITRLTRLPSLRGPGEFAWYFFSGGENLKDGIHHGSAFLQVSRKVRFLKVEATLKVDWKVQSKVADFPNDVKVFTKTLDVFHADVPRTPLLTDFTDADSLPIVVPREDVESLLGIEPAELDELISTDKLKAFGKAKRQITKGSLVSLLEL